MSVSYPQVHHWLLIVSCFPLLPLYTHSTPVISGDTSGHRHCEHESIPDLIKSSPVILKALGARIFTDYDIREGLGIGVASSRGDEETSEQFLSAENLIFRISDRTTMTRTTSKDNFLLKTASDTDTNNNESILITLTPETIYKGASLLKVTQSPDNAGTTAAGGESSYQYEGQLNATLEPLACFDGNVLKLLPTELIAFGKLVNEQQPDVLRISINGLHRWSSQFENHIWKYLGWDDWSDFTLCSVTCGKGVQQRFRRCLLDNPMININMNMNRNEDVSGSNLSMDIDMVDEEMDMNNENTMVKSDSVDKKPPAFNVIYQRQHPDVHDIHHHHHQHHQHHHPHGSKSDTSDGDEMTRGTFSSSSQQQEQEQQKQFSLSSTDNKIKESSIASSVSATDGSVTNSASLNKLKKRRKRKKSAKSLSTMSCEGYNIEQRNCNTFECSDDISDLLKFYKKFLLTEDVTTSAGPSIDGSDSGSGSSSSSQPTTARTTTSAIDSSPLDFPAVPISPYPAISSTPSNMGYVKSWRNTLNFTLMITLRVKNDTKTTSTIFSIRNATHNLYVEPSLEGLRFYQERDNATEMLPVKFNLYDSLWHQIAISIQNGDFISIYVDCLWTNSFVVSKRLFSLPDDADVEIGRGFNGELQQILILPDNQERHQCSSVRTSINEVKRYIIDTFIDDYGN